MLKPPQAVVFGLFFFALLLPVACGKKEGAPPTSKEQSKKQPALTPPQAKSAAASSPEEPPPPSNSLVLPVSIGRHTGDLDEMVKRRNVRALVLLSHIGFFYDKAQPRGIVYEALEGLQSFINKKLKRGKLKME